MDIGRTDFVKVDFKKYEKELKEFKKYWPSISRKMRNKVNTQIKKDARKEMRSRGYDTKKENGVYKNLFSSASKKSLSATVGIKRVQGFNYYAPFIEYGADSIKAKGDGYLCFMVGGHFVKVKEVHLPPRPFLKQIFDSYWTSGKGEKIMQEVLDKELKRLEEKYK